MAESKAKSGCPPYFPYSRAAILDIVLLTNNKSCGKIQLSPIGFRYRNSAYAAEVFDSYLYKKNLQGDILGICGTDGTSYAAYVYDAWGNFTVTYSNCGNNFANAPGVQFNPFTYRGYYYDVETGLYYLNSRYYNPQWGRFLNADCYLNANGDILGFNMFAYCGNNPVMGADPCGEGILTFLLLSAIGIACTLLLTGCTNRKPDSNLESRATTLDDIPFPNGFSSYEEALNDALNTVKGWKK